MCIDLHGVSPCQIAPASSCAAHQYGECEGWQGAPQDRRSYAGRARHRPSGEGSEAGIEPDLVRTRIDELKTEKAAAHAALPKLGLAPERQQDPAAILDDLPDLSERLRNADEATKRALFDAFDLRVVYDKASDRLSISATLTEAVAAMLRTGLEPRLCERSLRGWDSNPQPRS
jgi:hypothetical protein